MKKRPHGVIWGGAGLPAGGRAPAAPNTRRLEPTIPRAWSAAPASRPAAAIGWRISALETPRETPAPWKIVVDHRRAVLVGILGPGAGRPARRPRDDRRRPPGLRRQRAVRLRAATSACRPRRWRPLLDAAPGQRILLVGQSYGAAIATLMAEAQPAPGRRRRAAVQLSSAWPGRPRAGWSAGRQRMLKLIPRDLRNAVLEVSHQAEQLASCARRWSG